MLIAKKDNGLIKVITGVRRCGKSFLLFTLYREHLLRSGIASDCIVALALDNALNAKYRDPLVLSQYLESRMADEGKRYYAKYRDPLVLSQYLASRMTDEGKRYYIFLDEIQFVGRKKLQSDPDIYITFYDVLNGLLEKGNADIYVTGSNSRMLSHDVATEFRGRGDELRLQPLCFKEYFEHVGGSRELPIICCTAECRSYCPSRPMRKSGNTFQDYSPRPISRISWNGTRSLSPKCSGCLRTNCALP